MTIKILQMNLLANGLSADGFMAAILHESVESMISSIKTLAKELSSALYALNPTCADEDLKTLNQYYYAIIKGATEENASRFLRKPIDAFTQLAGSQLATFVTQLREIKAENSSAFDSIMATNITLSQDSFQTRFDFLCTEIIGPNAPDILCFQEDDITGKLQLFLKPEDFGSVTTKKANSMSEKVKKDLYCLDDCWKEKDGVSIFYRRSVFSEFSLTLPANIDEAKKVPFCCVGLKTLDGIKMIVACCHLPSGRKKYSDELSRIESIKTIAQALNEMAETHKCNNLILCMDANSPPICRIDENSLNFDYYEELSDVPHNSANSNVVENTFLHALCDSLSLKISDHLAINDPLNSWSVCKMRGPATEQPNKIGEPEYHLIDYIFVKGSNLVIENKATLPTRKADIKLDTTNLLPNYFNETARVNVSSSDHLPVLATFSTKTNLDA